MNKKLGIDRSGLPDSFLVDEQRKSNLILEANLLKAREEYEAAAEKFAAAAEIEERLVQQLLHLNRREKGFVHLFSAVSCWAQAGDLHRALRLGADLVSFEGISPARQQSAQEYIGVLRSRYVQWMRSWQPQMVGTAD
jgi:hypothetical protein